MRTSRFKWCFLIALAAFFAQPLAASSQYTDNFMVLGVIATAKGKQGVALLKDMKTGRTFASREGQKFMKDAILKSVARKSVEVILKGVTYKVEVGDQSATVVSHNQRSRSGFASLNSAAEVQKDGDTIKVSRAYKDHMVNANLSNILMQAAAVPHRVDGRLVGFRLWEIEPKSVFEVAGFKNGDIVTEINGNPIDNVAMAIRQLTALKNAPKASFAFTRDGKPRTLNVVVN